MEIIKLGFFSVFNFIHVVDPVCFYPFFVFVYCFCYPMVSVYDLSVSIYYDWIVFCISDPFVVLCHLNCIYGPSCFMMYWFNMNFFWLDFFLANILEHIFHMPEIIVCAVSALWIIDWIKLFHWLMVINIFLFTNNNNITRISCFSVFC